MAEETSTAPVPPYMSFATLLNQVERMEREGVPSRLDRTYLVGMAGGTRNQFKMGLRSLGLINENDQVTETMVRLAKDAEGRPALLAEVLRERFPSLVNLDENATRGPPPPGPAAPSRRCSTADSADQRYSGDAPYVL